MCIYSSPSNGPLVVRRASGAEELGQHRNDIRFIKRSHAPPDGGGTWDKADELSLPRRRSSEDLVLPSYRGDDRCGLDGVCMFE